MPFRWPKGKDKFLPFYNYLIEKGEAESSPRPPMWRAVSQLQNQFHEDGSLWIME